ncbi:MAG TPA: sugar-binding protein [Chthonomonadaceae bacterium]|nr:sugar-binding protein [Chthonomonadaceae bacterium]
MRTPIPLLGGLTLLSLTTLLVGCDPGKSGDNGAPSSGAPSTTSAGSAGSGGAPNSTGASEAPKAATSKPSEVAGAPHYKVITNGISPFWDSMAQGLYQADKDLQVNGDWQGPNPGTHNEQVKLVKDAVAAKMDGIAVSAIEADALSPTIDDATTAGVPVICFDSDAPKSKRLAYIGTDNYQAGKIAGTETVKLFPNGGKLAAFVGNMSAQNARDRYQGFVDAVKGHNITFVQDEPFQDQKDKGKARKNVEDVITKYKDINGLVGLYSYNGPAIVAAVQAANVRDKVKIICFDGEPDTLSNLSKGLVDVTVVQKPYEFGRLSIMLLNLIKKDKTYDAAIKELKPELDKQGMKVKGDNIDTGVDVITPANAADFIKKLKEKGLEST